MPHPLDSISIASPCQVDWNSMHGDNQVRFCGECKLNVYNLSGMSREEAETLIQNSEGRLCVRYFQRHDGTVITQDCPVGLRALHCRKINRVSKIAAVITVITVVGSFCVSHADDKKQQTNANQQNHLMMGKPMIQPANTDPAVMGEMAAPPQALQGAIPAPKTNPVKKTTQNQKAPKSQQKATPAQKKEVTVPPRALMGDVYIPDTQSKPKQ
jgi:hypothetical protein